MDFIPNCLRECREHYLPPVSRYISCECFGEMVFKSDNCRWCHTMTPYQWNMCYDAVRMRAIQSKSNLEEAEAAQVIEQIKQESIKALDGFD